VKVGDLVCWIPHKGWSNNGFGTIVEAKFDPLLGWRYKIMWHIDIDSKDGHLGIWYDSDDYGDEGNIGTV
jgi:hypothetical protein